MDESTDAVARSALALWLSGGALVVAFIAAGFTFWQAVTAHLARVRPLRADWAFSSIDPNRNAARGGWYLENTGGSTASNITLTVNLVFGVAQGAPTRVFRAELPASPHKSVRLGGTQNRPAPGTWYVRLADNNWIVTTLDKNGEPEGDNPMRLLGQIAQVAWTNEDGKRRTKRIPLY